MDVVYAISSIGHFVCRCNSVKAKWRLKRLCSEPRRQGTIALPLKARTPANGSLIPILRCVGLATGAVRTITHLLRRPHHFLAGNSDAMTLLASRLTHMRAFDHLTRIGGNGNEDHACD
jgi:hypothetical protein